MRIIDSGGIRSWMAVLGLAPALLFNGCPLLPHSTGHTYEHRAFIDYWPDMIALPTLQSAPPGIPPNLKLGVLEAFMLDFQNTVPVNFAGNPALAVPVPVRHERVRLTSLQLVGPPRSEAVLLNAGRFVEERIKK